MERYKGRVPAHSTRRVLPELFGAWVCSELNCVRAVARIGINRCLRAQFLSLLPLRAPSLHTSHVLSLDKGARAPLTAGARKQKCGTGASVFIYRC